MKVVRSRLVVAGIFMVCIASLAAAQAKRAMTIDDAIDLVQVSAPRISPDGRRVLYTRSELGKWKDNKRVTSIWIVDADGASDRRFLANEKDRSPAWSPDGRFVAFLSTRDAAAAKDGDAAESAAQVWVIPVDGGEASKLTDHKSNIRSFEWTNDSASIVFLAERVKSDAQKAAEKAGDDAIFVDEGPNGQDRAEFSELWQVAIADRSERAITHDDTLLIESFRVAPDGKKIARHLPSRQHQERAEPRRDRRRRRVNRRADDRHAQ